MKKVLPIMLFLSLTGGALPLFAQAQSQSAPLKEQQGAADTPPAQVYTGRQRDRKLAADAKWYYELGEELSHAKKYYDASKAFRRALMYRPDYADAYFGLGHVYADLGRWQEAGDAFEQVLRLDPKDEEARVWLGDVYLKLRAQQETVPAPTAGAAALSDTDNLSEVAAPSSARADQPAAQRPAHALGTSVAAIATPPVTSKADLPLMHALGTKVPSAVPAHAAEVAAEESAAHAASAPPTAPAEPEGPTSVYRVGPGDVLWVRLLNAPVREQPTLYNVFANGQLDYPLAGAPQQVAGLTTDEIAARLVAAPMLRTISEAPRVLVGVREYASHTINIDGLVSDPGEKVLRREAIPLYAVLAAALPQPEAGQVLIVSSKDERRTVPYDLNNHEFLSLLVYPGDQVTVEAAPAQFITIEGIVTQPGQKHFHPGLTLTQALLMAGGVQALPLNAKTFKHAVLADGPLGTRRTMYKVILTRTNGGQPTTRSVYKLQDIEAGKTPDPLLQPGDKLTVQSS